MGRVEKTVFISYRRTNAVWALAISQWLTFRGYDVFFDFEGIGSGDFEQIILENIRARAHFLVLLAPSALEGIDEPGDWLRREIETALEERRNIVPLLLEGSDFGAPATAMQLTGRLADLRRYNALSVPVAFFNQAMELLCTQYLNISLDAVPHPASAYAAEAAKKQQAAAVAAARVEDSELTASAWFERGFGAVDFAEKIRCYAEAIRLKPDFAEAYCSRGNTRQRNGDFDGALADYAEAIRLKPDFAIAYFDRGRARREKGDLHGALVDSAEAIRLKPDFAEAYVLGGSARKEKGDIIGALADYAEAIRIKPDSAVAHFNRGNARHETGDLDGALEDYTEAIQLKPDYAEAHNNRGSVRIRKGDLDGALADYSEAIRLRPDHAFAHRNRGDVRIQKGDPDAALADYTEAIRLRPDYAKAYFSRAVVLKGRHRYVAAFADLRRYLELGAAERGGDQSGVGGITRKLTSRLFRSAPHRGSKSSG